jgi:hypothetical protein
MSKLIELAKKYGTFKVTDANLLVPCDIENEDLKYLLAEGYHVTFEVSPAMSFIWCEKYLKGKQKESDG